MLPLTFRDSEFAGGGGGAMRTAVGLLLFLPFVVVGVALLAEQPVERGFVFIVIQSVVKFITGLHEGNH